MDKGRILGMAVTLLEEKIQYVLQQEVIDVDKKGFANLWKACDMDIYLGMVAFDKGIYMTLDNGLLTYEFEGMKICTVPYRLIKDDEGGVRFRTNDEEYLRLVIDNRDEKVQRDVLWAIGNDVFMIDGDNLRHAVVEGMEGLDDSRDIADTQIFEVGDIYMLEDRKYAIVDEDLDSYYLYHYTDQKVKKADKADFMTSANSLRLIDVLCETSVLGLMENGTAADKEQKYISAELINM